MSKMFTDEIVCEFKANTKNKINYTNYILEGALIVFYILCFRYF
jgi:hypothetical protein